MVKRAVLLIVKRPRSMLIRTESWTLTRPVGSIVRVSKPNEKLMPRPTRVIPKARTRTLADPSSRKA